MAYLEILDNLDNVADDQKKEYTEVNGKFQRDVEMPDINGLKTALQKERDAVKEYDRKLALYKDVDPEKYAELLRDKENGLSELERYENAIKKQKKELDTLKTEYEAKEKASATKLQKFHADKEARSAALAAGVIPEDIDDVLILTKDIRSMDDDGKIILLDADGDPTSKTLKEYFEKDFKELKPKYYPGIAGGGGATGGKGVTGDWHKLSPRERINQARGM